MPIYNIREQGLDSCSRGPDEQDEVTRESVLSAEIRRRVQAARAGNVSIEMQEVLADLDAPLDEDEDDGQDEDADPAEVEAAWAEELQRRVEEMRSGSVRTYALEDVLAAMELRFG